MECTACDGRGTVICSTCHGLGIIGYDADDFEVPCANCNRGYFLCSCVLEGISNESTNSSASTDRS